MCIRDRPMVNSAHLTLISCRVETELSQSSQKLPSLDHKVVVGGEGMGEHALFLFELLQSVLPLVQEEYRY